MEDAVYSDDFMMNNFKVEVCVLTHPHIWKTCPYVHPGEPIKRRPHTMHHPDLCPDVKRGRMCSYGPDRCYWAHNTFESWLHPERYRTIMCRDGTKCNRAICFFAHGKRQVRRPSPNPNRPAPPQNNNNQSAYQAAASNMHRQQQQLQIPQQQLLPAQNHNLSQGIPGVNAMNSASYPLPNNQWIPALAPISCGTAITVPAAQLNAAGGGSSAGLVQLSPSMQMSSTISRNALTSSSSSSRVTAGVMASLTAAAAPSADAVAPLVVVQELGQQQQQQPHQLVTVLPQQQVTPMQSHQLQQEMVPLQLQQTMLASMVVPTSACFTSAAAVAAAANIRYRGTGGNERNCSLGSVYDERLLSFCDEVLGKSLSSPSSPMPLPDACLQGSHLVKQYQQDVGWLAGPVEWASSGSPAALAVGADPSLVGLPGYVPASCSSRVCSPSNCSSESLCGGSILESLQGQAGTTGEGLVQLLLNDYVS